MSTILSEVDVHVTFDRTDMSLKQILRIPTGKKCNVVHVIPCHSCPELCIGQTSATSDDTII